MHGDLTGHIYIEQPSRFVAQGDWFFKFKNQEMSQTISPMLDLGESTWSFKT